MPETAASRTASGLGSNTRVSCKTDSMLLMAQRSRRSILYGPHLPYTKQGEDGIPSAQPVRAQCPNQSNRSLNATTSPMNTIAGGRISARTTRAARSASVPTTVRCDPTDASQTAAAGVAWSSPCAINCSQRSEEHTSELQSRRDLVCRLLLEKK